MFRTHIISIFTLLFLNLTGQSDQVRVMSDTRMEFAFPWAGGMNSCQFGKIDLNLDNTKDLVVFDRTGDRIMPFLAVSSQGNFYYQFAPEYTGKFPVLAQWAVFEDYNLDGNVDIFTYSPGFAGLKVYKNISVGELEFELEVYPYLKSFQGGGYVNILVTYADYPAFTDLDGDGDLDILTFYGLGAFVEKHRNMSMEKYGSADSLDYEKVESCWGFFAESEETNAISLDTCLRSKEAWGEERHTGSTFRVLDLNADALPDLLLGDVDYPNLIALYNGGTLESAMMTGYDWEYPAGNQPVRLFSMPAAFYDDFDFDGVKDLLVSPFDPNPFLPENFESSWLYQNNGIDDQPAFNLVSKSFLQDKMLDFGAGAYPVFFDFDQDGLTDLFVGNYGYYDTSYFDEFLILHTQHKGQIAWLKNTGTVQEPAFTLIDRDFAGISELRLTGIYPAFDDLDGDGDSDLLTGCENGKLIFYKNNTNPEEDYDFDLVETAYQSVDVGSYSSPQFFDLDQDGLNDLIIGEKGGNLNYYRNTGSPGEPIFTLVTDSLGKINVTDYNVSLDGYSTPFFYRDGLDQTHLLAGSEQGELYYYTGIDGNLDGPFVLSDTLSGLIGIEDMAQDFGYRSSSTLSDIDHDSFPELVAGNFSGGLNYISKNSQSPVNHVYEESLNNFPIRVFPNPTGGLIQISCHSCNENPDGQIALFDITGKELINQPYRFINHTFTIDLTGADPGVYILRVRIGGVNNSSQPDFFVRIIRL